MVTPYLRKRHWKAFSQPNSTLNNILLSKRPLNLQIISQGFTFSGVFISFQELKRNSDRLITSVLGIWWMFSVPAAKVAMRFLESFTANMNFCIFWLYRALMNVQTNITKIKVRAVIWSKFLCENQNRICRSSSSCMLLSNRDKRCSSFESKASGPFLCRRFWSLRMAFK